MDLSSKFKEFYGIANFSVSGERTWAAEVNLHRPGAGRWNATPWQGGVRINNVIQKIGEESWPGHYLNEDVSGCFSGCGFTHIVTGKYWSMTHFC